MVEVTREDLSAAGDLGQILCALCEHDQIGAIAEAFANHRESALLEGVRIGLEVGAAACEQQRNDFLSPEYATGQPLSSFNERFACGTCASVITALDPAQVLAAHRKI